MMSFRFLLGGMAIVIGLAAPPALAGYAEGLEAYRRGDARAALDNLRPLARQEGDARAQLLLGLMYLQAMGVARSARRAADWFRQAAEQGQRQAQYLLGVMYANGYDIDPVEGAALK